MTGQEATVIDFRKEVDALASWPTRERTRALNRILPRARVEEVLARTGHDRARCPRLPGWFLIWFVIALGLFCRDCYRQVFRRLQPFRQGATPGRTTLCEARKLRRRPLPGPRPPGPPRGRVGRPAPVPRAAGTPGPRGTGRGEVGRPRRVSPAHGFGGAGKKNHPGLTCS